jgi:UDP-N-acetylmuramoyl-tripeptide--D-alanyl-D-alanine ligase
VRIWSAERIAEAAGASLLAGPRPAAAQLGPERASIDTRTLSAGELFIGLRGAGHDGGEHATAALEAGAWGVLVSPEHGEAALAAGTGGAILTHEDPLAALQALAGSWRAQLRAGGAKVLAVTGSTGKTSTKDILAALLAKGRRTAASPANFNTEIGLPLALLAVPVETEALVLEMAMRGSGQIAELTAIADPDVGVIVNVGEAHLELLGSIEAIAAAKAELIAGCSPGASVVIPAREPLLEPHLRPELRTITFGEGGDVSLLERREDGGVVIAEHGASIELRPSFGQAHNLRNLLAAVAAAGAIGYRPEGRLDVTFSALRGQRVALAGGVTLIDDCYNANPMSMRAAIDDLAETAPARSVAVLGDMLELGVEGPRLHREIGAYAAARGVELLLTVGPLAAEIGAAFGGESHAVADAQAAAELLAGLLVDRDTVLVKGSRGVGLERVAPALGGHFGRAAEPGGAHRERGVLARGAGPGQR